MQEFDSFSGILETYSKDGTKTVVKRTQDVESIIDCNTIERNAMQTGWKGDFHKVASIPLIVIEQWREELKASGKPNINPLAKENKAWFIARLNNRDFQKLRTKDGNI